MTITMDQTDKRAYSMAGEQMPSFSHIVVASNVDLPDGESAMDDRIRYRATGVNARAKRGVPIFWAGFFLMAALLAMLVMSIQAQSRAGQYHAQIEQFQSRFYEIANERAQLEADIALACDSAKICYYAARELGMQLAVDSQTIHVIAPTTRTGTAPGQSVATSSTGGYR